MVPGGGVEHGARSLGKSGLPVAFAALPHNSGLTPQASIDVKIENKAKLGIRVSKKTSVFETFETLRTEKHGFPAVRRELPEFQAGQIVSEWFKKFHRVSNSFK